MDRIPLFNACARCVALFDVKDAELITSQLFNVTRVDYEFEGHGNVWFLRDGDYFTQVITDVRSVSDNQFSGGSDDNAAADASKEASD
jgi:hypothetical protein